MTAEYGIAEPFELRPPGTVQKKKGKGLRYSSLDHIQRCFAITLTAVILLLSGRAGGFASGLGAIVCGIEPFVLTSHAVKSGIHNHLKFVDPVEGEKPEFLSIRFIHLVSAQTPHQQERQRNDED